MKMHNKVFILLTLTLLTLTLTIGLVNAQPAPIGGPAYLQPNPFESNPTAYTDNTLYGITLPTAMYDGRLSTEGYFQLADWDADTDIIIHSFDNPAATFTIGWVDLKINYKVDPVTDDTWNISYTVGAASWWNLVPETTGQFDSTSPPVAQTCVWSQIYEPNDGVWSWADITNLKVRFYTTPGLDGWSDYQLLHVYEVWATVYAPPLPLGGGGGGAGISIVPSSITTLAAGRFLFLDVYARDVTALAGYQFTINFNTTVLMTNVPSGSWSYYPFTDQAVLDLNDALGYCSMSYSIPIADPLSATGVSGKFPIARLYFRVETGMTASAYSWLTISVSILGNPAGNAMPHSIYPGLYGTPPPDTYLFSGGTPITAPLTTNWIEVYPDPGVEWHLSSWYPNGGGDALSASDQIDMTDIAQAKVSDFHVDKIWEVDQGSGVTPKHCFIATLKPPGEPEFPLGIGILTLIVPVVPIVYIWRLRKKNR